MLTELLSKHQKWTQGLARQLNPSLDWKTSSLQASHGDLSPYPVSVSHPPSMDINQTLAEYRKVKTEDAPSNVLPQGDKRDVLLHHGTEATPVKVSPHIFGGHIVVGGAGNRLNGLRIHGVRPNAHAGAESSINALRPYESQGIQATDYPVAPSENDWSDYVNNLTHQDSDNRNNAEDGMATRNRNTGLRSLISSRVPPDDGLVVVSPMGRLREAHNVLKNERGSVGFYDEDGTPHGDVTRTAITPDPNFATMDVPRHIVYYDSAPNELHKTHNVASAHKIISTLDQPVQKASVSGHWRMSNGEPSWVSGYTNSRRQAVHDVAPPQISGMSIHQFDGGASASGATPAPQQPMQPTQPSQEAEQSSQNPIESYAQLGTKSPYFQNWFKESAVHHHDTGDAIPVYPAGTLNDTGDGLEPIGKVRNALGTDLHFTSKPSSDTPSDINPASVPVQYRHPVIDHLSALNVAQGQGGLDERLQRAFLTTGNLAHLGLSDPQDQSEAVSSLQRIMGSNQGSYLSVQNPIRLTQSLKPQDAQAMLQGDPPLFHSVQAYKTSQGYRGEDWSKTLNAGDIIGGATSIGRQQQIGDIFGRAGYDGIYHRANGEDHWIPFSVGQVKAQANVGTFDPQEEDIYKALGEGIPSHPEWADNWDRMNWSRGSTRKEPSNADYDAKVFQRLQHWGNNGHVSVRFNSSVLPDILAHGGLRSVHETVNHTNGSMSPFARAQFEKWAFGVPHDIDTNTMPLFGDPNKDSPLASALNSPQGYQMLDTRGRSWKSLAGTYMNGVPSERFPIYAHIKHDPDADYHQVKHYGDSDIILKPHVRDRSTITVGDSLFGFRGDQRKGYPVEYWMKSYPSAMTNPETMSHDPNMHIMNKGDWNPSHLTDYMEAQIHGGVKTSDFDHIIVHKPVSHEQSERYQSLADAHGIPIHFAGGLMKSIEADTEELSFPAPHYIAKNAHDLGVRMLQGSERGLAYITNANGEPQHDTPMPIQSLLSHLHHIEWEENRDKEGE